MGSYYVFCGNNQSYYALTQNCILCSALTHSDFDDGGASFLSQSAVFVTDQILPRELRALGSQGVYHPVAFELDPGSMGLTGWPVIRNASGLRLRKTTISLSKASTMEGFVGMFLPGAVPISLLSGILFENEEDRQRYPKSSPDLWFPEDLMRVIPDEAKELSLSREELEDLSEQADELAEKEKKTQAVLDGIEKSLRRKAALYFALEATEGWGQGFVKTNLDSVMIDLIDEKQQLKKAMKAACKVAGIPAVRLFPEKKGKRETSEARIEESLKAQILALPKEEQIGRDGLDRIRDACLPLLPEEVREEYRQGFEMIDAYCYARTQMDPDQALKALAGKGSLQALMLFLDQQRNAEYLRNAARRLGQREKRLSLMFFGLLRGMDEVEGKQKSNRRLEYRLERVAAKGVPGILPPELPWSHVFLAGEENEGVFGLQPVVSWVSHPEDIRLILRQGSDAVLEKVYEKFLTDVLSREEVYSFAVPVEVTRTFHNMAEVEAFRQEMMRLGEVFQGEKVREYLNDKKVFSALFQKKGKDIQAFCKRVRT